MPPRRARDICTVVPKYHFWRLIRHNVREFVLSRNWHVGRENRSLLHQSNSRILSNVVFSIFLHVVVRISRRGIYFSNFMSNAAWNLDINERSIKVHRFLIKSRTQSFSKLINLNQCAILFAEISLHLIAEINSSYYNCNIFVDTLRVQNAAQNDKSYRG